MPPLDACCALMALRQFRFMRAMMRAQFCSRGRTARALELYILRYVPPPPDDFFFAFAARHAPDDAAATAAERRYVDAATRCCYGAADARRVATRHARLPMSPCRFDYA